jgi:hypothetical protein
VVLVVVAFGIYWLEALFGRGQLRRHVTHNGWVLISARWRPHIPSRQVRFKIEIQRHGRLVKGTAQLGGYMTGPVFSRRIELDCDDAEV